MHSCGYETLLAVTESEVEVPAYCVFAHRRKKKVMVCIRGSKTKLDWTTNLRAVPKRVTFSCLNDQVTTIPPPELTRRPPLSLSL